ncbi:MAG: hypothetical protein V7739_09340 [Motiliproteus sp.]
MTKQDRGSEHQSDTSEQSAAGTADYGKATWGPWLLRGVFLGSAVFAWWLVIYDHGVVSHH